MKAKLLLTSLAVLFITFVSAQTNLTIKGVVKDDRKQPLPGATVMVKGTSIGTVTDDKGEYTLQLPDSIKKITISYIGFDNIEVPIVAGQTSYDVNMSSTNISLNQVVVSVSKRKEKALDAPASVSIISQEKLERNIVTTPVEQLKTTPGVDVMRTGLIASNVVIRGFNNIFSGAVLNVIDNRIGSVPSLRVNAYQLVPTSTLDYERIEVVRGPASALYGPNASSGVIHIMTKSPLEQAKKFETTVAMTGGFTILDKSYQQYNNGSPISGNIINPEIRHSGKLWDGKFGYKISGSYFQGEDYPNYDPREPYTGDSLIFGSVRNGQIFTPDTLKKYTHVDQQSGQTILDSAQLDVRRFKKDFSIRKFTTDARIDIQPIKDLTITVNGGVANSHNIELTGLGAGQAGGDKGGWTYWYFQTRVRWKNLFVQYFINSSNAGKTYLIPQLSDASRSDYNSTSPPTPYQVQFLVDKSKIHVAQIQYSTNLLKDKLNFIYGVDALLTRPNTEGTINGRFEPIAKLNQIGGYVQGDYSPINWLKIVAAIRVDYNSIINNVAASPRGALVFKVAENQNVRVTYNRAFDSPNTLNQFLDLSNGLVPNGINVRGIGNPFGWNYRYDGNGAVQFKTAPYGSPEGQWVTFNDKSANAGSFEQMYGLLVNGLTAGRSQTEADGLRNMMALAFDGIRGNTGTVAQAEQLSIDFAKFAQTKDFAGSIQNTANFKNLKRINNQYTQTVELGYKGLLFKKLSLDVDVYWSHISNYVSALSTASGAVTFDYKTYLGENTPGGLLYDNIHRDLDGFGSTVEQGLAALNNNPGLQNPSIVAPDSNSVWDELVVLMNQVPIGTITPDDPKYVGSDFILTYKNLGNLDVFGVDFGFQYNVYEDFAHNVSAGGSVSWVNKDQLVLSSGEGVPLNAPKVKASVVFDHILKKSGFGYGLSFRYQMAYDASSAIYVGRVDPAYLLDLRLSYRPATYKNLLLSINVNNATNYQWRSFPGTPLMGAQVFMRAQVTF